MKKNEYVAPEVESVKIEVEAPLLQMSNGGSVGKDNGDEETDNDLL